MKEKKEQKPIKGIVCDACHCAYHGEKNECCAKEIAVGPQSACCSTDTVCTTFKPKNEEF